MLDRAGEQNLFLAKKSFNKWILFHERLRGMLRAREMMQTEDCLA